MRRNLVVNLLSMIMLSLITSLSARADQALVNFFDSLNANTPAGCVVSAEAKSKVMSVIEGNCLIRTKQKEGEAITGYKNGCTEGLVKIALSEQIKDQCSGTQKANQNPLIKQVLHQPTQQLAAPLPVSAPVQLSIKITKRPSTAIVVDSGEQFFPDGGSLVWEECDDDNTYFQRINKNRAVVKEWVEVTKKARTTYGDPKIKKTSVLVLTSGEVPTSNEGRVSWHTLETGYTSYTIYKKGNITIGTLKTEPGVAVPAAEALVPRKILEEGNCKKANSRGDSLKWVRMDDGYMYESLFNKDGERIGGFIAATSEIPPSCIERD